MCLGCCGDESLFFVREMLLGEREGMKAAVGEERWNVAAQERVLTGLLLGVAVAVLGSLVELGLVFGACILL